MTDNGAADTASTNADDDDNDNDDGDNDGGSGGGSYCDDHLVGVHAASSSKFIT